MMPQTPDMPPSMLDPKKRKKILRAMPDGTIGSFESEEDARRANTEFDIEHRNRM